MRVYSALCSHTLTRLRVASPFPSAQHGSEVVVPRQDGLTRLVLSFSEFWNAIGLYAERFARKYEEWLGAVRGAVESQRHRVAPRVRGGKRVC